ncbi:MAG: U32 family peptidase [Coprococcus sp.]
MLNRPEILAPAGTVDSVKAAVNAGADAIYVGGNMFSARAFAGNFDTKELLNTIDYCHINNVKLYMAVNTLLKNNEINYLADYMEPFVVQGIDGVIVQDMGVYALLRRVFPELPLHASTQMSITSSYGAEFLKKLGFTRFVPARELSLKEIQQIKSKVDIEIETFVHGAMCYCYSGKCLMSSYAGGRSGNRGRCAQPCRKLYSGNGYKEYSLSLKDMCMLKDLNMLIDAGIDSFKIEGRMKKPEYVAATVYAYKEARDAYLSGGDFGKTADKYIDWLLDIYNRGGFSTGYYFTNNGKKLLANKRPNHEGIQIGVVSDVNKPYITIKLANSIYEQDILEIRTAVKDIELTSGVASTAGTYVKLKAKELNSIKKGDRVYRTRNNHLLDNINKDIILNTKKVSVDVHVTAHAGLPLKLDLTNPYTNQLISVEAGMVSKADNRPVTRNQIFEKLSKTGGTEFDFNISGDIDDGIFVQLAGINALRRGGICALEKDITENFRRRKQHVVQSCDENITNMNNLQRLPGLTVYIKTLEQFRIVNNFEFVENVIVEYNAYKVIEQEFPDKTDDIYVALPYVLREQSLSIMDSIYNETKKCRGYLIKNIDQLAYLIDKEYNGTVICDSLVYAYNNEAICFYKKLNDKITFIASNELRLDEINQLDYMPSIKVYGYQPVMYSANCTNGYYHNACKQHKTTYTAFYDDMKNRFYASNDCMTCGSVIYNGIPTDIIDYYKDNKNSISDCLIDFTIEDGRHTTLVMERLAAVFDGKQYTIQNKNMSYTKGHYFRGIE